MGISEYQRQRRKEYLGSSDLAAILGLDPYKNAHSVWVSKVRPLVDEDVAPSALAEIGNTIEDGVIALASRQLELKVTRNQFRVAENGCFGANCDAICEDSAPLEVKTSSLIDEWGPSGTDQVPERALVQTYHQMICTGSDHAYVAALLSGFRFDFRLYRLDRNDKLAGELEAQGLEWWARHVVEGVEPADVPPQLEALKRIKREAGVVVGVDAELIEEWIDAKEVEKTAKGVTENLTARVIAALGTAECGECPLGVVTYKQQSRQEFTVKASSFRVLRFKGEKGGSDE